ncbi:MAG TPA: bifunctional diguanylate cyclase/phosphodiesterase, partial [Candidatus Baltobacteraceae bacterium]|nr:bifunctional diguanylate cyclase/phosphodiesterase [Candidatus Baltobacteraceae bacterium]
AYSDPLTGLPNRASMETWLGDSRLPLTLAVFDLDRKKLTTNGLSPGSMDELMIDIAQRIQSLDTAFVARVESDEFACAFGGDVSDERVAKIVFAAFDEPFALGETEMFIPISIGIAHAHTQVEAERALRHADLAMYRSQRSGRSGYTVFRPEVASEEHDTSLISELHRAYRDGEFTLFYQPIVRITQETTTCIGVEALLRWEHPTRGLIEPAAFLETLASLRLAERVGSWVLNESCRQLRAWSERGVNLDAWINLFTRQALDPNLASEVAQATGSNGVLANRLVVEIVENVVSESEAQIVESIRALRAHGVRTAIDDFGTGHSSLSRLREVPADIMKIDRSFINRSEEDPKARAVIQAVLLMAEELHYTPLAEGVENEAQLQLLRGQGCEYIQGFHIARPMRAAELEHWISATTVGA